MICTRNCLYQFDGACGLKLCSSDATNRCPLVPDEAAADTPYKPPKTNADHIRSMTDEELAALLDRFCDAAKCRAENGSVCPFYSDCASDHAECDWKVWLKQPYKEELNAKNS